MKRSGLGSNNGFLGFWVTSNNYFIGKFTSDDKLQFGNYDGGSYSTELVTNRVFKDVGGWYHIVYHYNSAENTESGRAKIWVNGVQETSFATANYPSLDANTKIPNAGYPIKIGEAKEDKI